MSRTTFFEEQERYRRATWRWTLLAAVAVAVMGIPLSIVLTPLVYLALLIGAHIINLFYTLPAALWSAFEWLATSVMRVVEAWDAHGAVAALRLAVGPAVAMILPGMMTLLGIWWRVRRRLASPDIAARAIATDDLEERQLANVVDEMAIAAGMPAPRLMIVDGAGANVAVLGTVPDDAVVVVARAVLDTLDRGQTQGLMAHALAFIAHDDLAIAARLASVEQTSARLHALEITSGNPLLLPLHFINLAVVVITGLLQTALITPIFSALWRTRRYLADASAVQLTREPSDLSRALEALGGEAVAGWDAAPLHVVVGGRGPQTPARIAKLARHMVAAVAAPRHWRVPGPLELAGAIVLLPLMALFGYLMVMVLIAVTLMAAAAMGLVLLIIYTLFGLIR
ncbi:MAG TPA: M48 family metalloprotease [Vicinamibacterales bacterium]|nr:M48 family metalloprotease [Vicinamibacterales bacterium]